MAKLHTTEFEDLLSSFDDPSYKVVLKLYDDSYIQVIISKGNDLFELDYSGGLNPTLKTTKYCTIQERETYYKMWHLTPAINKTVKESLIDKYFT
jgi:hypothetical protein